MDDNKIIKIHSKYNPAKDCDEQIEKKNINSVLHTNPIIQNMLSFKFNSGKSKFSFKDLFR